MMSGVSSKRDLAPAFFDLAPARQTFLAEVLAGFSARPKAIPCKYLYDAPGSALFEKICELPEYYLTRTELFILKEQAAAIAELIGPHAQLIELGSGSSHKIQRILQRLDAPAGYVPIDISRTHLRGAAAELSQAFPHIPVTAICADYMGEIMLPKSLARGYSKRVAFFPGSTIGNLKPAVAVDLLRRIRRLVGAGGELLIGIDTKKDPAVLHAAYNDRAGVTAAFSLNLLARINRELSGDFDLARFAHEAFYNPDQGRVEIYLKSLADQLVHIGGLGFHLCRDERIHIEYSYKYTPQEFHALAREAGFDAVARWGEEDGLFSVHYLRAV